MLDYSVVIPFGKKDGDFSKTLSGIFSQEIQPREIIIICNNGITLEYFKSKYQINEDNVTLIEVKDKINANVARNIGIEKCKSDWVAFLDSDDWWDSSWVQAIDKKLKNDTAIDFIYGSIRVHHPNSLTSILSADNWKKDYTPENYLLAYKPAQTSTYFMKTILAKNVKWDNTLKRHQDYDFFVRIARTDANTSVIPECHVNVDWTVFRKHKYHLDCYKVTKKWRKLVDPYYFRRHCYELAKSAFKSYDWKPLLLLTIEIILPSDKTFHRTHTKSNL